MTASRTPPCRSAWRWNLGRSDDLDFEGTAPVTAGPVNIALPTAIACCYVAIKHIFPACQPMPA
jgi:N-methylhydantoinase B/oxoprolinase/acetone carboxylase alpha subunit